MKVFSIIKCFCLLGFLVSCGGNAHLLDAFKVSNGASQTGIDGTVVAPPTLPEVNLVCQHPDGLNFISGATGTAGACDFRACVDDNYSESLDQAGYQLYIDQHGGSITSDSSLCLTHTCSPSQCQHKDAINTGEVGECKFVACTKPEFMEYNVYLGYQAYVDINGGQIDHQESLCVNSTLTVSGCTEASASNFNPNANKDDCSCKWSVCNDNNFQEFHTNENTINLSALNTYLQTHGGQASEYISENTCKTPVIVYGCTDPAADNTTTGATSDDKSCKYSYCIDPNYVEFDVANNEDKIKAAMLYSQAQALDLDVVTISTCKVKKTKCLDRRATNTGAYGQVCHYNVCNDASYEEFQLYLEIKPLADQGLATFTEDASQCVTKYGCTEASANQTTVGATIDNGTCRWNACLDDSFEEFDQDLANLINNYAQGLNLSGSEVLEVNTCQTVQSVEGCKSVGAANYNADATVDNGSCKFNLCADCTFADFDTPENLALVSEADAYAQAHSTNFSSVVGQSTCSVDQNVIGCKNPYGANYSPAVKTDNGSCMMNACLSNEYPKPAEYNFNIAQIISQYASVHPNMPAVGNTCGSNEFTLRIKFDKTSCDVENKTQVAKLTVTIPGESVDHVKFLTSEQPELKTYHGISHNSLYRIELKSHGYKINGEDLFSSHLTGHKVIRVSCE